MFVVHLKKSNIIFLENYTIDWVNRDGRYNISSWGMGKTVFFSCFMENLLPFMDIHNGFWLWL